MHPSQVQALKMMCSQLATTLTQCQQQLAFFKNVFDQVPSPQQKQFVPPQQPSYLNEQEESLLSNEIEGGMEDMNAEYARRMQQEINMASPHFGGNSGRPAGQPGQRRPQGFPQGPGSDYNPWG